MTWSKRFKEALFTAAVVGGYTMFRAMQADDPTAMFIASRAGEMAFVTIAGQMGIALNNSRSERTASSHEA